MASSHASSMCPGHWPSLHPRPFLLTDRPLWATARPGVARGSPSTIAACCPGRRDVPEETRGSAQPASTRPSWRRIWWSEFNMRVVMRPMTYLCTLARLLKTASWIAVLQARWPATTQGCGGEASVQRRGGEDGGGDRAPGLDLTVCGGAWTPWRSFACAVTTEMAEFSTPSAGAPRGSPGRTRRPDRPERDDGDEGLPAPSRCRSRRRARHAHERPRQAGGGRQAEPERWFRDRGAHRSRSGDLRARRPVRHGSGPLAHRHPTAGDPSAVIDEMANAIERSSRVPPSTGPASSVSASRRPAR